jgi:NAD(P)-dependent dehydrogenase (short-subunit alcohol dehydrogenase family)
MGKTVIVTGANGGIGSAICRAITCGAAPFGWPALGRATPPHHLAPGA